MARRERIGRMTNGASRFDEGFPIAIAREESDPEAYMVDEAPEPDVVWDVVDDYAEWYSSYDNADPDVEQDPVNGTSEA
jgi:hypothetical protein